MGKSSSNDELTIRNQFDRICKLALKGEAAVDCQVKLTHFYV